MGSYVVQPFFLKKWWHHNFINYILNVLNMVGHWISLMQKNDSESGGDYVARKIPKKKIKTKNKTKQQFLFLFREDLFSVNCCGTGYVISTDRWLPCLSLRWGFPFSFFKAKVAPMMPFNLLSIRSYAFVFMLLKTLRRVVGISQRSHFGWFGWRKWKGKEPEWHRLCAP